MENKLKVGDIVVAKRDEYGITNKSNGWIGKILSFNEYGRFTAKTLKDNSGHTNDIFYGLETDCFELASEEENKLLEFANLISNILELHLKWLRSEKGGVRADLSRAEGVLSSIDFMNEHFEKIDEGYIAYKTFGTFYSINPNWKIKVGEVLKENVNFNRNNACGCGINVAPLKWVKNQTGDSPVYKVLIRNEWLMGVCVPYLSDGEIRCERVEILGVVDD